MVNNKAKLPKKSTNKIIIKKGGVPGRRETRAREAVCVQ